MIYLDNYKKMGIDVKFMSKSSEAADAEGASAATKEGIN